MEQRPSTLYSLPVLFGRYKGTSLQRGYQLLTSKVGKNKTKQTKKWAGKGQKARIHVLCHYAEEPLQNRLPRPTCHTWARCTPGEDRRSTRRAPPPLGRLRAGPAPPSPPPAASPHTGSAAQKAAVNAGPLPECRPMGGFNGQEDGMSRGKPQLQVLTIFETKFQITGNT